MEMPEGWKRLCGDIPHDKHEHELTNEDQEFLWNTADLIKEMAEALEYTKENADWYDAEGPLKVKIALIKFKEWK